MFNVNFVIPNSKSQGVHVAMGIREINFYASVKIEDNTLTFFPTYSDYFLFSEWKIRSFHILKKAILTLEFSQTQSE